MEAFDILELMCELVRDNVKSIEAEKTCPYDLIEAVSTLLYASTRTEISELDVVRKQFTIKYGKDFVEAAMDNQRGVVNERILHRMSGQRPNAFLVLNYMKELAKEYNVDWEPDEVTEEAGQRFDAPMVGPDGSSIAPGAASGLGTGAYQVTDGSIVYPGENTLQSVQKDAEKFHDINNAIIDNSAPRTKAPFENTDEYSTNQSVKTNEEDELDLDSLTARFQAFKDERKNGADINESAQKPEQEKDADLEFDIPIAPTHDALNPEDRTAKNENATATNDGVNEDKGAIPKYDELLSRFAKLKSGK